MAGKRFLKKEAIRFGWESMKNNLVFFAFFVAIVWIVQVGISLVANPVWGPRIVVLSFVSFIIGWMVSIFVTIATTKIGLRLSSAAGETAEISDVWSGYPRFLDFLIGSVLYGLLVTVGLILFIVPGIYWGIKYSMFGYCIIDKEMPPVAAMKESGKITMGAKWDLFLLGLLFFGIFILGLLACVVGLFAAVPTILVAHAYVYRKLAYGETIEQVPQVTPPPEAAQTPRA